MTTTPDPSRLVEAGTDFLLAWHQEHGRECDPEMVRQHVLGTLLYLVFASQRRGVEHELVYVLATLADDTGT